jgi:hypothetical protein
MNVGGVATDGSTVTLTDDLPAGFSAQPNPGPQFGLLLQFENFQHNTVFDTCDVGPPVTCTYPNAVQPGEVIIFQIPLQAPASGPATVTNQLTISGGGAAPVTVSEDTPFNADPTPFGIESFDTLALDSDGSAVTQAGAHPYDFRIGYAANTAHDAYNRINPADTTRNVSVSLPPGLVFDPGATPKCTEAQLETPMVIKNSPGPPSCPSGSVVGNLQFSATIFSFLNSGFQDSVYNMIAPPGSAASFAMEPAALSIYIHVLGGVDPARNYALSAKALNIPEFGGISASSFDFWGDPSSSIHDPLRGACGYVQNYFDDVCPVPADQAPFLSMPSACSGPLSSTITASSWQNPGAPDSEIAQLVDNAGNPQGVTGCDQLAFAPTLTARPTTNVADSPSGLDVDLQVPQNNDLNTLATSTLKKAVVTLPQGLTLNPSAANGLEACSSSQIGIDPSTGTPNGDQPSCPDASKLGTVQVTTPLLENPLPGSVYLAKPHDNPFDSELAIYLVVDDPQSGVIVKLPGKIDADPDTGQLTATFDQNPQLPFSDFKLSFFGGPTGALRTPEACREYATDSELTPWSGTPPVDYRDEYAISQGPSGECPSSPEQQPNSPSFDAGSVSPTAGNPTPFVLNLSREDATQHFSQVTVSPPPGWVAKLAGTPECSDAQIAQAEGRSAAGDGAQEQAHPSCPAASEVGTVSVAAGAGPSPYHVTGKAYLAGPYKGAPLSLAIITPGVAGPFDLGVVVTRVATRIDPVTARVTASADPIPDHLIVDGDGFPLDVRSVAVHLDKPDFARNGTSCDPSQISGSELSTLGQSASLSERFQLAECANLEFAPKLGIRLFGATRRGAHPRLRGMVSFPEGGANVAQASVALPHSEFLDQGHIGTVCTRVQFAEGKGNGSACPPASVYGHAVATSPLVDYALEGSVFLRSSDHELPDLVAALHGPPSQPLAVDVVGRVDSVHGGIRTTFEGVPDVPVSKFVLNMLGGNKGLLQNSTDICAGTHKATALFDGQNAKTADLSPALRDGKCPKPKRHKKHHHRRAAR